MDSHGHHFQAKKREANAISKVRSCIVSLAFPIKASKETLQHAFQLNEQLQLRWKAMEDKKTKREEKLPALDEQLNCCKRKCCGGAIETCYLRELRRKFLEQDSQVERKRFLIQLRDCQSPTGFAIVQEGIFPC
jgi:hypothetical protein